MLVQNLSNPFHVIQSADQRDFASQPWYKIPASYAEDDPASEPNGSQQTVATFRKYIGGAK